MIFRELELTGAFLLELERHEDERGFFARAFCRREFEEHGLDPTVSQANLSYNRDRGTLRGMHYQVVPSQEAKTVRCVAGALHDVIVDLRPGSATYGHHTAVELSADNRASLYVPAGLAHGFQTLAPHTEVYYLMSEAYSPEHARGFRHDDPALGIRWPLPVSVISERDATLPLFADREP